MTKKVIATSVVMGAMFTLIGCGGGSGGDTNTGGNNDPKPATVTGVFQDANVAGLNYACSSGKTDVTTNEGEYTCNVGDTVEFSLGGYVLGSVNATSGVVTPMALYPDNLEAATNVLQLLQTLDSGEDGTITIPDNFSALDDVTTPPSDPTFDDVMEEELGEALVEEGAAQTHMLKTLLAGKTLYTTIWDDIGTLESWSFNEDLTSSTWTELVGGSATGTGTLSADGMILTFTCTSDSEQVCETEPTTIEVKEILADYLVLEVRGGELGTEIEILRLYFDEAKARAYLLAGPATVDLTALLGGKTFYNVGDDYLDRLVFNADVTSATWTTIAGHETGESGTDALRIEGNKIVLPEGGYVVLVEITNEYLLFNDFDTEGNADGQGRFYFEQAKAEAYFSTLGGGSSEFRFTTDYLIGKTLYLVQYDDFGHEEQMGWNAAKMIFNANGAMVWNEIETIDSGAYNTTYSVDGNGQLSILSSDAHSQLLTYMSQTEDYLQVCDNNNNCETYLFFDEAKALAFRDNKNK